RTRLGGAEAAAASSSASTTYSLGQKRPRGIAPGPSAYAVRRLERVPQPEAEDPRVENLVHAPERSRVGLVVVLQDGVVVRDVEAFGAQGEGRVAELDVLGQSEVQVPEVLLPLRVDGGRGLRPQRPVATRRKIEPDRVGEALAAEERSRQLEVPRKLIERVRGQRPLRAAEDVRLAGAARLVDVLAAVPVHEDVGGRVVARNRRVADAVV